jgi:hypothetical protein
LFDHIIVAEELLPVRQAAGEGDIEAMFSLLEHIIRGEHTAKSGRNANFVLSQMFGHKDSTSNHKRFWNTLIIQVHTFKLLHKEGEISYREYIEDGCTYLQMMIESMTGSPRRYWNYNQLINCIDWIRENEPKLQEEEAL